MNLQEIAQRHASPEQDYRRAPFAAFEAMQQERERQAEEDAIEQRRDDAETWARDPGLRQAAAMEASRREYEGNRDDSRPKLPYVGPGPAHTPSGDALQAARTAQEDSRRATAARAEHEALARTWDRRRASQVALAADCGYRDLGMFEAFRAELHRRSAR